MGHTCVHEQLGSHRGCETGKHHVVDEVSLTKLSGFDSFNLSAQAVFDLTQLHHDLPMFTLRVLVGLNIPCFCGSVNGNLACCNLSPQEFSLGPCVILVIPIKALNPCPGFMHLFYV